MSRARAAALALAVFCLAAPGHATDEVAPPEASAQETAAAATTVETPGTEPPPTEAPQVEAPLPISPPSQAEVLVMPTSPTQGSPQWVPSATPDPKQWEWVRLTSDEWLKGEITVMRKESLEFDSDELDEQKIDWDDVKEIRSPRTSTYAFTGRRFVTGRGFIDESTVTVASGAGILHFPRADLISIVPGKPREIDHWSLHASLSVSLRRGNADQTDLTTAFDLTRRTAFTRFLLDYNLSFGGVNLNTPDENITADNQHITAQFDLFVWRRLFVTPAEIKIDQDKLQSIYLRVSPGAGLGYEILDGRRLQWDVQAGGVYRYTQYTTPLVPPEKTFAVELGTSFEWDITSRLDLDGNYSASISVVDPRATNQSAKLLLSVELNSIFDLDATFQWNRTGLTPESLIGDTPQGDDVLLSLGLAIDL